MPYTKDYMRERRVNPKSDISLMSILISFLAATIVVLISGIY